MYRKICADARCCALQAAAAAAAAAAHHASTSEKSQARLLWPPGLSLKGLHHVHGMFEERRGVVVFFSALGLVMLKLEHELIVLQVAHIARVD